ncbi:MAG: F0F1 ATP synthase subunit delta [Gammaproteobacteria bacterium]|nr:F0F1 ATP synthase subunit delta [Gammaproteobacteria bacterium]MBM4233672.1 F0F1 ATP synthase subunit delta [Gammaproteobacteria bacterium]
MPNCSTVWQRRLLVAEEATIARPYARAAFEHAYASGQLAAWSELLERASIVVQDERVRPLVGNPHVSRADMRAFVSELAGAVGNDKAINLFHLLDDNGRLSLLPQIAAQYAALRADVENTVEVTVISAQPLSAEQSEKLTQALSRRLRRTVRLSATVDRSLIGGAIVRTGDFVVDGSLRGRIERLGNVMAGA